MSQGKLTTALHNFGTSSYFTKKRQGLFESVKRRQCSFEGRKALLHGKSSCIIPEKVVTIKVEHKLSTNVRKDEPAAKKHPKAMLSTTRNTVTVQSQKLDVIGEKKEF